MITCSCGKTIEKVPNWMQSVQVDFVCNNCPNRHTKNIAVLSMEVEANAGKLDAKGLDLDEEEEVADEEE
jgi:hypothetical protein